MRECNFKGKGQIENVAQPREVRFDAVFFLMKRFQSVGLRYIWGA
jgi:hypothetical protein